jgi:hypothetical protein
MAKKTKKTKSICHAKDGRIIAIKDKDHEWSTTEQRDFDFLLLDLEEEGVPKCSKGQKIIKDKKLIINKNYINDTFEDEQ